METLSATESATTQIKKLLDARMKNIYDRNLEGILSVYTPDVVTFDFKEPLKNRGLDAVKNRLEEWFASYKSPISQEITDLEIAGDTKIAFSHCLTRTCGTGVNGKKQDMWYRTTTGYKKEAGKWIITHEHVSDPVDMETGKAIFDLKP